MIVGGILITLAFITFSCYYTKPINKYSLKYYKLKWRL